MIGAANISPCGTYRYTLERHLDTGAHALAWLMLNPSTADATEDDPTIRKVLGFTERAGYGAAIVVNLYALRQTNPRAIWLHAAPIGPENDEHIIEATTRCDRVVCAWGAHLYAKRRAREVIAMLRAHPLSPPELLCLGTTQDGHPRHPLYVPYAQPLIPFVGEDEKGGG